MGKARTPFQKRYCGKRTRPYQKVQNVVDFVFETTEEILAREAAEAKALEKSKETDVGTAEKRALGTGWKTLELTKQHVEWHPPLVASPYLTFNIPRSAGKPSALDAWCAVTGPDFYQRLVDYHKDKGTPLNYPSGDPIVFGPREALLYHGMRFGLMSATERHRNTDTMGATKSRLRDDWTRAVMDYDKMWPNAKVHLGISSLEKFHAQLAIPFEMEDFINTNLLGLVSSAGEAIAGDEKAYGGYHEAENMKSTKDKQPGDQIAQW